jgi:hypothetical protein
MTAPECLITRPATIHPSRLRAPARSAEVRSNSDNYRENAGPKIQNGPAFRTGIGVRAAHIVAAGLANSKWANWRQLKSHR